MIAETQTALSAVPQADVLAALKAASAKTGSDFNYLLTTAMRESGLDSHAKSTSSSASGLFQFIEQTWLGLVKHYGERHGLKDFAAAIRDSGNGRYEVASKEAKSAILALRQDAQISSLMAGEAAHESKRALECKLGRAVCSGELYAAHFLGEGGARRLIELNASSPNARADVAFPQAANVNRGAFFDTDGRPKTVAEVYAWAVNRPNSPQTQPRSASIGAASLPSDLVPKPAHPAAPMLASSTPSQSSPTWIRKEWLPNPTSYLKLSPAILDVLAALAPVELTRARA
jgi:hypothetical protein